MALLNTDFLTARTQTFRATRHMLTSILQEGVEGAGDYKVTPTGTSLQWSVAAGEAWVQGDDTTRQGLYHQVNDGAVTGLVAAGHATNPRIDQVILRIFDSSVTGGSDTPTLSTLAGTATGGATLDNRTGAAALPNGAIRLADILVPALHSGVLVADTHIRDRRPWATQEQRYLLSAATSLAIPVDSTADAIVTIDAELELSEHASDLVVQPNNDATARANIIHLATATSVPGASDTSSRNTPAGLGFAFAPGGVAAGDSNVMATGRFQLRAVAAGSRVWMARYTIHNTVGSANHEVTTGKIGGIYPGTTVIHTLSLECTSGAMTGRVAVRRIPAVAT